MIVEKLFNLTLIGADWVLWLLICLSVISVSIMVERAVTFITNRTEISVLKQKLAELLQNGKVEDATVLLKASNSPEARICLSGMGQIRNGIGAVEETVIAETNHEKLHLEKNLAFLGTVGSNAPFIGLFGTVLGIIKAFHDLSLGSKEGAAAVMAGISEALVATAVGLLVAIPAVVAFNYFKQKAQKKLANADSLSRVVFAYLKSDSLEAKKS